jgi:SPOR domain
MFTIRTGKLAWVLVLLVIAAGCSREQQDWRSAEAADTSEAYDQFIQRHPDSELVTEARTRVAQLGEDRDWHEAGTVDTADAYRQFLTQHPNGKWAQEARIRIESFALGAAPARPPSASGRPPSASAAAPPRPLSAPASAPANTSASTSASISASGSTVSTGSHPGAGVQLGAFNTDTGARKEWQVLTARFGPQLKGLAPHIVAADTSAGRVYRLQALVGGEERARAVCEALKQQGQGCMPLLLR